MIAMGILKFSCFRGSKEMQMTGMIKKTGLIKDGNDKKEK